MKLKSPVYSLGYLLTGSLLLIIQGCARVPPGATFIGPQLIVSMTVASPGTINASYYYYVLFNATNNPVASQGPTPVTSSPWGNGFAAGQFTGYVLADGSQSFGGYGVYSYSLVPNTNPPKYQSIYLGSPINTTPITPSSTFIQFTIPLSQLATSSLPASSITAVQINFINTDRVPLDPNDPNPKEYDALGDARIPSQVNDPITIPVQQAGTYTNASALDKEPEGDVQQCASDGACTTVSNPSLDIVDWSVQVVQ